MWAVMLFLCMAELIKLCFLCNCFQLFIVNTENDSTIDIPRLQLDRSDNTATSCGIHTISTSEERKFLATGGANPTHLAIYGLPEMQPLAIGEVYTNCVNLTVCTICTHHVLIYSCMLSIFGINMLPFKICLS